MRCPQSSLKSPLLIRSLLMLGLLLGRSVLPAVADSTVKSSQDKKLIEFGWDMPNSFYVRDHIQEMEALPFDGLVISARYQDASGRSLLFHDHALAATPIEWSALVPAVEAFAATRFIRFTDNFLRLNISPLDRDWFARFSPMLQNCRLAGRIVAQGKLKGVFLDLVPYQRSLFQYSTQKRRKHKQFGQYAAQVRRRARALISALQSEAPGLTVFINIGYDHATPKGANRRTWNYGLLPAFLDGLFAGAKGSTILVDGFAASAGFSSAAEFGAAYQSMYASGPSLNSIRKAYTQRLSAGFALWLDFDSAKLGWSETALRTNYFSPEEFEGSVTEALVHTDRYVWIYSEQPEWWTGQRLPTEYVAALRRARAKLGLAGR